MPNYQENTNKKQQQLTTVIAGVLVPIIGLLAITENYYLLGIAIVVELAMIAWSVALVRKADSNSNRKNAIQ